MSEVSMEKVQSFVNAPKLKAIWDKHNQKQYVPAGAASAHTRRNRRTDIATLFSHAVRWGYCTENLATKLERVRLDSTEPGILTVPEAQSLLKEIREPANAHLLPFVALGLFGGLRPSEAQQLTWSDVRPDAGQIRIAADRGKSRANRFVTINETLKAWLAICDRSENTLPIAETRSRKVRAIFKRVTGKPWPKDGFRHSFVTYHFAIHGEGDTAAEAGHSEDMMRQKYKTIVTTDTANKFWEIRPEKVTSANKSGVPQIG